MLLCMYCTVRCYFAGRRRARGWCERGAGRRAKRRPALERARQSLRQGDNTHSLSSLVWLQGTTDTHTLPRGATREAQVVRASTPSSSRSSTSTPSAADSSLTAHEGSRSAATKLDSPPSRAAHTVQAALSLPSQPHGNSRRCAHGWMRDPLTDVATGEGSKGRRRQLRRRGGAARLFGYPRVSSCAVRRARKESAREQTHR